MKGRGVRGWLRTFFLVDIVQGLWVTLRIYFGPKVTVQYPERTRALPERFKGILRLFRDEAGEPLCIACKLCQKSCPTDCFRIEGVKDGKRGKPTRYDWKLGRCIFCGLCVEVCPTDAIRFTPEFRMTTLDKRTVFFTLDEMYARGEELQRRFCAPGWGDEA